MEVKPEAAPADINLRHASKLRVSMPYAPSTRTLPAFCPLPMYSDAPHACCYPPTHLVPLRMVFPTLFKVVTYLAHSYPLLADPPPSMWLGSFQDS